CLWDRRSLHLRVRSSCRGPCCTHSAGTVTPSGSRAASLAVSSSREDVRALPRLKARHRRRRRRPPVPVVLRLVALRGLEIDRRGLALLAAFELIADLLAFDQVAQPRTLDGGDMDEHVLRAVFGLDEPIALL